MKGKKIRLKKIKIKRNPHKTAITKNQEHEK